MTSNTLHPKNLRKLIHIYVIGWRLWDTYSLANYDYNEKTHMGAVVVGVIAFTFILLFLFWIGWMNTGGVQIPESDMEPWDYGLTKVGPIGCIGFVGGKNGLVRQTAFDQQGNKQASGLPPVKIKMPNSKGEMVDFYQVARMGVPAYKGINIVKDKDGGYVKDGYIYHPRIKGNFKDCCTYIQNNGTLGAAVYDPIDQSCYVFDWMNPETGTMPPRQPVVPPHQPDQTLPIDTLVNVFPIYHNDVKEVSSLQEPPHGSFTYMMACGGQGYPPCVPQTDSNHTQSWPPETEGCSKTGDKGNITLYRTPVGTSLPFSKDTSKLWEICETMSFIRGSGYHPQAKFLDSCTESNGCLNNPNAWEWADALPQFDPKTAAAAPFDLNTSNAWYMSPWQYTM